MDGSLLAEEVDATYYHPEQLSELNCTARFDWASLFKHLRTPTDPARLKILEGMTVNVIAQRDKDPQLTFEWPPDTPFSKEDLEGAIKQTFQAFFQFYWSIVASSIARSPSDKPQAEARSDGGSALRYTDQSTTVVEEVDRDHILTKIILDSPTMKGTLEPYFSPSPDPKPGDLRRLTSIEGSEEIGESIMKMNFALDYQTVGAFAIPHNVTLQIPGAYSVPLELTGCSVKSD